MRSIRVGCTTPHPLAWQCMRSSRRIMLPTTATILSAQPHHTVCKAHPRPAEFADGIQPGSHSSQCPRGLPRHVKHQHHPTSSTRAYIASTGVPSSISLTRCTPLSQMSLIFFSTDRAHRRGNPNLRMSGTTTCTRGV